MEIFLLLYLKLVIHLSPKHWPNQWIALTLLLCECSVCVLDISHFLIDFTQELRLLDGRIGLRKSGIKWANELWTTKPSDFHSDLFELLTLVKVTHQSYPFLELSQITPAKLLWLIHIVLSLTSYWDMAKLLRPLQDTQICPMSTDPSFSDKSKLSSAFFSDQGQVLTSFPN